MVHHHVVPTERCGALNVYVQGDLESAHGENKDKKCVFLTVHDMGTNHHQWLGFVNHPCMLDIRSKSIFVHVDLLGQEDDAKDLEADKKYPSMQEMGEDLVNILDTLRIKFVIGLGCGVGANVIARFGMMHKTRCLGIVCIHPTSTKSGVMEHFKDKFSHWKKSGSHHDDASEEEYLVLHKYGHKIDDAECKTSALESYKNELKGHHLNKGNMNKLVKTFMKRDDMTANMDKNLQCEAMLVCGTKSHAFVHNVDTMYSHCDKTKTSVLKIDDVGDVLEEVPVKFAQSILLFCKGLGWLTSLTLPGVDRQRSTNSTCSSDGGNPGEGRRRSMSMEEYDRPNIRRLSLTPAE